LPEIEAAKPDGEVMDAVNVTGWPYTEGFGVPESAMVVGAAAARPMLIMARTAHTRLVCPKIVLNLPRSLAKLVSMRSTTGGDGAPKYRTQDELCHLCRSMVRMVRLNLGPYRPPCSMKKSFGCGSGGAFSARRPKAYSTRFWCVSESMGARLIFGATQIRNELWCAGSR
jgi:hypothetical protein